MEPVAGIPHGGFYEGGRAQEANSLEGSSLPPPRRSGDFAHYAKSVLGFGFASSSGQSGFWMARNPSYRRSATFCVHEERRAGPNKALLRLQELLLGTAQALALGSVRETVD